MFDSLKDRLQSVFSGLGKRGALSEGDVDAALREVRLALLEADVALPVVRQFMERIREKAVGAAVLKAVRPDQQVIKLGTHKEKGSGLGLILCKEFIEMNNGEISVDCKNEKGCTFSFSLPIYKYN